MIDSATPKCTCKLSYMQEPHENDCEFSRYERYYKKFGAKHISELAPPEIMRD